MYVCYKIYCTVVSKGQEVMDTFVSNVIYTHCVQWRIEGTHGDSPVA